jgi:hypothetical protein
MLQRVNHVLILNKEAIVAAILPGGRVFPVGRGVLLVGDRALRLQLVVAVKVRTPWGGFSGGFWEGSSSFPQAGIA